MVEFHRASVTPPAVVARYMHLAIAHKAKFQLSHRVFLSLVLLLHQGVDRIESGKCDIVVDDEEQHCVEIPHHHPQHSAADFRQGRHYEHRVKSDLCDYDKNSEDLLPRTGLRVCVDLRVGFFSLFSRLFRFGRPVAASHLKISDYTIESQYLNQKI